VMKLTVKAPAPGVLGTVGKEHLAAVIDQRYRIRPDGRTWHQKAADSFDGVAFVFEILIAEIEAPGEVIAGVNYSPAFGDPFANNPLKTKDVTAFSLNDLLEKLHARPYEHPWSVEGDRLLAVAAHLIWPGVEVLDRGKSWLEIPPAMAEKIADATWKAAKDLYQEEEARKKDAARAERAERARRRQQAAQECNVKDAVFAVLPEAVEKGTEGGKYPIGSRSLFYAVRKAIQRYTDKELDYGYFSQGLLTQYKERYGPIPGLYYDPRGLMYEPRGDRVVEPGTREVEEYELPLWRYDKILFIEKKGLWPVLQSAKLAERYDMAIIASEGYATEACRTLLQHADRQRKYRIFVLHDADPHGYNIARTLREATWRMPDYAVDVVDLGLRFEEGRELSLETEQFTRKQGLPAGLELIEAEQHAFIERKLKEHGADTKVVPPKDVLVAEARSVGESAARQLVADDVARMVKVDTIAKELEAAIVTDQALNQIDPEAVRTALMANREQAWNTVVRDQARNLAAERTDRIKSAVREAIAAMLKKND
jgi:hypothetical protein